LVAIRGGAHNTAVHTVERCVCVGLSSQFLSRLLPLPLRPLCVVVAAVNGAALPRAHTPAPHPHPLPLPLLLTNTHALLLLFLLLISLSQRPVAVPSLCLLLFPAHLSSSSSCSCASSSSSSSSSAGLSWCCAAHSSASDQLHVGRRSVLRCAELCAAPILSALCSASFVLLCSVALSPPLVCDCPFPSKQGAEPHHCRLLLAGVKAHGEARTRGREGKGRGRGRGRGRGSRRRRRMERLQRRQRKRMWMSRSWYGFSFSVFVVCGVRSLCCSVLLCVAV
jgi:hypothetical protein